MRNILAVFFSRFQFYNFKINIFRRLIYRILSNKQKKLKCLNDEIFSHFYIKKENDELDKLCSIVGADKKVNTEEVKPQVPQENANPINQEN